MPELTKEEKEALLGLFEGLEKDGIKAPRPMQELLYSAFDKIRKIIK